METRFKSLIGTSPKTFSRIVRFNKFISKITGKERKPIIGAAYECEYFDQSHLIKDFRLITSRTPKKFLSSSNEYEKKTIELLPLTL